VSAGRDFRRTTCVAQAFEAFMIVTGGIFGTIGAKIANRLVPQNKGTS
jgi:hypothetical protein